MMSHREEQYLRRIAEITAEYEKELIDLRIQVEDATRAVIELTVERDDLRNRVAALEAGPIRAIAIEESESGDC